MKFRLCREGKGGLLNILFLVPGHLLGVISGPVLLGSRDLELGPFILCSSPKI